MGKVLADLDPIDRDHYRLLIQTTAEKETETKKDSHSKNIDALNEQKKEVQAEKGRQGNPSSTTVREELGRERFTAVLLMVCLIGEFVFARWCIEPFGLGLLETNLVAATIVIILLEGVHHFLSWLKQTKLPLYGKTHVVLACVGMALIFLLIYLISEIRGILFQTTSALSGSAGIEEKAKQGTDFFGHTSRIFMLLMAVLTSSITIIGGLSFHQTKEKLFKLSQLLRLGKKEKALDQRILIENQNVALEDTKLQNFLGEVEDGLYTEITRQNRGKRGFFYRLMEWFLASLKPGAIAGRVVAFSIVVLIFVTCFFLWTALARGESIAFFDMSKSVEVTDYAGQETEFQRNIKGGQVFIEHIPCGEPFKMFGITDRTFSQQYLLLEGRVTTTKGYFGEKEAKDRLALVNKWKQLRLRPLAGSTDIFGAAHLAASLFNGNSGRKNLIFFSDMRQNTHELNLEKFSVIDAEAVMKEVKQRTPIPSLHGVRVWCLGVHSAGRSPSYWNSLKHFWEKYFQLTNVSRLQAFSMERKINFE